ncbi:hypothetical protein GF336_07780 [Candidatus Woesearchaeota archaeon]|nr:hypothetical protein [Candidatus Woesearchaeota archaeon]
MAEKIIQISGKDYYLFDKYGSREQTHKIAKTFKKERKCKYFILPVKDRGLLSDKLPSYSYLLYFNKKLRIW